MNSLYVHIIVGAVALAAGVLFDPALRKLATLLFTDVKTEYTVLLADAKSLYDADTKSLRADLAKARADWAAEVTQLKSDLATATSKFELLKSIVTTGTPLPAGPTPAPAASTPLPTGPTPVPAATARSRSQIAADLAATQAAEAQLQADLAAATS
jgi:hypothetical protein